MVRSVHYSFRIDQDIFAIIEKEAQDRKMSISSLMNGILAKYARSDRYFERLGFILMSKDVLRKWLDRIENKFLIQDSKVLGSTVAREYISYLFHDINNHTLAEFLDLLFSTFEYYQHKIDDKTHSFAIKHDINVQYSIYLKEFLKALIEPIISKELNFAEVAPNVISFSFEE
jgi:hypothetical protein